MFETNEVCAYECIVYDEFNPRGQCIESTYIVSERPYGYAADIDGEYFVRMRINPYGDIVIERWDFRPEAF